jgi:RHS repeat-associated protein
MDDEIKGEGNSYTTEFRQYDPRLGRWLSLDPLMAQFPWMSPYVGMDNNPVLLNDPMGLSTDDWVKKPGSDKWVWDDNVKVQGSGNFEVLPDGTQVASAGYIYPCVNKDENGMNLHVQLGDGKGKWQYVEAYSQNGAPINMQMAEDEINRRAESEAYNKRYNEVGSQLNTLGTIMFTAPFVAIGGAAVVTSAASLIVGTYGTLTASTTVLGSSGMLTTTTVWQASTGLFAGGTGILAYSEGYFGQAIIKGTIDASMQGAVKGIDNIDWADATASGLLSPGASAIFGGSFDITTTDVGILGVNKSWNSSLMDMNLKYAFGSKGVIGKYPAEMSKQMINLGAPQLAPLINVPFSLESKIAQSKLKKINL